VTCEVCPHHLFLTTEDIPSIGQGAVRSALALPPRRPGCPLAKPGCDRLLCDRSRPPHSGRKRQRQPSARFSWFGNGPAAAADRRPRRPAEHGRPGRAYGNQPAPHLQPARAARNDVEIDLQASWEIRPAETYTRCGWTPFEGWQVRGRPQVVLRGKEVFGMVKYSLPRFWAKSPPIFRRGAVIRYLIKTKFGTSGIIWQVREISCAHQQIFSQ
jgi:carbamoyl-phosphate synthase / aspartate carbamoyltransferase / dihydroorotase